MRFTPLPPQILRLVLLAAGIVATYAVARVALTPASFGRYGHYRGAALEEIASREPTFAGAKACDECHSEVSEKLGGHEHRGISCESCHGPARAHANNPDLDLPKRDDTTCLRCHAANPARAAVVKQIDAANHFDGHCIECHVPHQPKESP